MRFGQLYKPITSNPFKEAGIKGFSPIQPYKVAPQLALTNSCLAFHWPSVSELNNDIALYCWESEEEHQSYLKEVDSIPLPFLITGPPLAAPTHEIPAVPSISLLVAAIVRSTDSLFFVSCRFGDNDAREWWLARVALMDSMSLYPSCTLDGRSLFECHICHPADWWYNVVNQRFWLQLHSRSDLMSPCFSSDTHLVRPTDTSDSYVACHKLMPFRKWLNICHQDTYIHGPFEFASVRGRKTQGCVAQSDWDILHKHSSMFNNPVPRFDVPTYSIHCDRGAHVTFHDKPTCAILMLEHSRTSDTEDIYHGI
jgi:hypothetical protein